MGNLNNYDKETYDFKVVMGDTSILQFEFYDEVGVAKDITSLNSSFLLKDPITGDKIYTLFKDHDDGLTTGPGGIYYFTDANHPPATEWGMSANNQLVVLLENSDTQTLEPGVYPFDLQFQGTDSNGDEWQKTAVKGHLIVQEEINDVV